MYDHFDEVGGISFLPYSDHTYAQAPMQQITEEQYNEMCKTFPKINWESFDIDEHEDTTTGVQTLACAGGFCEI